MEIAAEGLLDAGPEAVFAFLSDLDNHWLLADRFVEVVSLEVRDGVGQGGMIRLRGPLALRRTANTRVLAVSPGELVGSAEVGHRTRAILRWTLRPHGNGTSVRLCATVLTLGMPDRLLLAVGGEHWLRGRFVATIARLGERMAAGGRGLLAPAYISPRSGATPRLALPRPAENL